MTTQNDPLLKQAEILVEVAQIIAIALYQSARNDFLFLRDMNVNHWGANLIKAGSTGRKIWNSAPVLPSDDAVSRPP